MKKFHYVYRITNKILNKHYYGIRSSNIEPKLDLGKKYFSSSHDKEFTLDQKLNPLNFKYKIIRNCTSREEAVALEIKLHKKFNVASNETFYNLCNATKFGFTVKGNKDGCKRISAARKCTMPVKDSETGEIIGSVSTNHENVLSGKWVHTSKGRTINAEERSKRSQPGEKNARYSGYTDDELLNIVREYIQQFGQFDKNLYIKFPKFPKSFSECRFNEFNSRSGLIRFKMAYKKKFNEDFPKYIKTEEHKKKLSEANIGKRFKFNKDGKREEIKI